MSAIPFTDRELKCAWRELSKVSASSDGDRQNPHRLLLFYAVECGRKAVWLKRGGRTLFEGADTRRMGHDLQQLLKDLRVGSALSVPGSFELPAADQGGATLPRKGKFGDVHQAWRYGGRCQVPTDLECERQLLRVQKWIEGELR